MITDSRNVPEAPVKIRSSQCTPFLFFSPAIVPCLLHRKFALEKDFMEMNCTRPRERDRERERKILQGGKNMKKRVGKRTRRRGEGGGGDGRKRRVELDGNTDRRNAKISLGNLNDMQEYRSSSRHRRRISDARWETLRK